MKTGSFKFFVFLILLSSCITKAQKAYMKGEKKFRQGEYEAAIPCFVTALEKGYAEKALPNYYIAESYRLSNRIQFAKEYYEAAIGHQITEEDATFYYAFAQKAAGDYEGAEKTLKSYLKTGLNFDFKNRARNELENLKVIRSLADRKTYFYISRIEHLNSAEEEYSPFCFDGKLYFTSSRGAEKIHTSTGTGFTDLYEFDFDGVEKHSGTAAVMSDTFNTPDAHEASGIFSPDGHSFYFARGNSGSKKGPQDVDIYVSTLGEDGAWGAPQKLPFNEGYSWDSTPALSADGNTLYFASNREGGYGGTDLYRVSRNPDGTWGTPVNLGTPINTRGNELFPYERNDSTFYFSSDGHPSFGKLDLFIVRKEEDKRMQIENLGSPMNTSYDDFGIVYRDSIYGYISSDREGGEGGDDIYEFRDESLVKEINYWLDLTVLYTEKESRGKEFILPDATIKLIRRVTDTIATMASDSLGKVRIRVEPETYYTVLGLKDGFMTEEIELSTMGIRPSPSAAKKLPRTTEIIVNSRIILPRKEKQVLVIDNIYYDLNKANIRPDAAKELFKIAEFMRLNPDITIELSSHTDCRGTASYNRILAQQRADSAVAYIISQGVPRERISARGYGEDRPLVLIDSAGNKTVLTESYISRLPTKALREKAHDRNRRTEIEIIDIGNRNIEIRRKEEELGLNIQHN